MNGYIAFFKGKRIEIRASNMYAACWEAQQRLGVKPSQRGLLAVALVERAGKVLIHSISEV